MDNNLEQEIAVDGDSVAMVKSGTPTKSLAVFITTSATKEKLDHIKIRGIGAGAVNQMVKAVITAKSRLSEKGITTTWDAYYRDVDSRSDDGKSISAIEFNIKFS